MKKTKKKFKVRITLRVIGKSNGEITIDIILTITNLIIVKIIVSNL